MLHKVCTFMMHTRPGPKPCTPDPSPALAHIPHEAHQRAFLGPQVLLKRVRRLSSLQKEGCIMSSDTNLPRTFLLYQYFRMRL